MLQNKLVKVQRLIQEPCHIEKDLFATVVIENLSFLSQKAYFRCGKVFGSVFDIE